ncbi:cysteine desulfurase [Patescibacteria group bacterium]|nr:cysteine desulfurase [Patescibacteria group bacterium]MBU1663647.1 cysteine desulfurase [Patescibacteria group bacterium]MBU1934222.1 cysteine desulfurase [Patescibacteria group bacterium]MBU2007939.1 cysteine desulfurase [Patescibacteria group bacterium]MBU2233282.1 cysteine desulfurase [Patescibacteria group bacterium]
MRQNKKSIYLDHSATTPVDKNVLKAMLPYFSNKFGNPSSIHGFGQTALAGVDVAREKVAKFLNCSPLEIIFTSGATEADNLAIFGVIDALSKSDQGKKLHIITSVIEHPAVLEPFRQLEAQGMEVTYLPVEKNGIVNLDVFKKSIRENTVFVSIMYVNSEVGSIQPIREIGKIIEKINRVRIKENKNKVYFHTDAVQALNFLNCDIKYLHVDLLSLSGHKIYGPKGVGALFVKQGTLINGVQLGGHHEKNLRSGTLNVPGIVGLGQAIKICGENKEKNNKKIAELRNEFIILIKQKISNIAINTDINNSTPSHANISFIGAEGESILIALDLEKVAVSTGSACASASLKASPVLSAMGIKDEIAHSTIRFTFGKNNTLSEIEAVLKILPPIIEKLRHMAPEL